MTGALHSNIFGNRRKNGIIDNDRKINPALHLKSDNLQYDMVGRWVDGTIVLPSDGPMFILIDWE